VGGGSGLDSAQTIAILDSNYMANRGGYPGLGIYHFDATAGQTVFQESDASGSVLSYTENGIIVFYNGVRLPKADYTATDGTSVTLVDSADSADVISIVKWGLGGGAGATWYGDRGLIGGGTYPTQATIDYFTIASPGNATDFGDLGVSREDPGATSDGTYGIFASGYSGSSIVVSIDYVTIATPSNGSDFGDLITGRQYGIGTACDGTYGLFAGVFTGNEIEYVVTATPGNGTDFGDLTANGRGAGGVNDATRACFGGRDDGSRSNIIDYVTIASPGNATDFGDLTAARSNGGAFGDTTRGCFAGGQAISGYSDVIDYITIQTTSNATDFGDLTGPGGYMGGGMSDATYGVTARMNGGNYANNVEYVTIQTTSNATDFGDRSNTYSNVGQCAGAGS